MHKRDPALHQYHFEFRNGSALATGSDECKQILRQAIGRLNLTLNLRQPPIFAHTGLNIRAS